MTRGHVVKVSAIDCIDVMNVAAAMTHTHRGEFV
jgi:hypothetical protein